MKRQRSKPRNAEGTGSARSYGDKGRRRGFTLIELLVVIAVIAVLMGILMPALQKTRKMAKATVCRFHLKEWGFIFHLYAADNQNKLPQSIAGGKLNAQEAYWIVATLPYYKEKDIRICPSTKVVRDSRVNRSHGGTLACWGPFETGTAGDWWADFDTGSYGLNEWVSAPPPSATSFWGFPTRNAWRTTDVKGADQIPLFMDCVYVDVYPQVTDTPMETEPDPYDWSNSWGDWGVNAMRLVSMKRHGDGINIVFLNGNTSKVSVRDLWGLKWHKNFNTNNRMTGAGVDWPQWMQ